MESPTHDSHHISKSSKKMVFPGGSSSSSVTSSKKKKNKKNKVASETIVLDDDALVVDEKAERKGKRKKMSPDDGSHSMSNNVDSEILRNLELLRNLIPWRIVLITTMPRKSFLQTRLPPKVWAKRIQEEWKILENDLPDTIFVRVFESRMDLLRAVIVGAEGTPYHDGLFFFDIFFPTDYPSSPPKVYYHSGGLRINPNLYANGYVCLSLLNTWDSHNSNEKWVPNVSTMLQVLVSIQGLILNVNPYFNEPGYERSIGTKSGDERSFQYNESTFLHSLQTMVYTMNKPPKNFEALVVGHFCKLARDILVSCKAYLEGVQVGCLVKGGVQDVDESDKGCSENFKKRLAGFVTTLIDTLTQIGAKDCQEFLSLAQKVNGPEIAAAPGAVN